MVDGPILPVFGSCTRLSWKPRVTRQPWPPPRIAAVVNYEPSTSAMLMFHAVVLTFFAQKQMLASGQQTVSDDPDLGYCEITHAHMTAAGMGTSWCHRPKQTLVE